MYGINLGLVKVERGPSIDWQKLVVSTLVEWINQGQVGRTASAWRYYEIQKRKRASMVEGQRKSASHYSSNAVPTRHKCKPISNESDLIIRSSHGNSGDRY